VSEWRNQPYLYAPWPVAAALVVAMMTVALTIANSVTVAPEKQKCVDDAAREKVQRLMMDGLDEAMRGHTKKMYDIWMQDSHEQPRRAIEGMDRGINAYLRSRAAALKWNPPAC